MQTQTPTLIIGAGPAGLAVAGRLAQLGRKYVLLEQSDRVGWSWHNHYERLCLHTVKQLSHLPHLPFPEEYPLYVPREDLIRYFKAYVQQFDIQPLFGERVCHIQPQNGQWQVECQSGKTFLSPHVVLATGVNRVPYVPGLSGQEQFEGDIIHSREYRNPQPFAGQKVLIVGMGNTGAEIALDLAEANVDTWLSVRSPVSIVPRDVMGNPVQTTARKLDKLPFGLGDWLGTLVRKIVIGNLRPYGVPMSSVHPAQQLKETGKTPVIDLGTVRYIKSGKIRVRPDIDHFSAKEVVFVDGTTQAVDSVILATGYKAQIEDFLDHPEAILNRHQLPKSVVGQGAYRGLYFIGFDNYKLGGILGTIYTDSEIVAKAIVSNL